MLATVRADEGGPVEGQEELGDEAAVVGGEGLVGKLLVRLQRRTLENKLKEKCQISIIKYFYVWVLTKYNIKTVSLHFLLLFYSGSHLISFKLYQY